MALHGSIEEAGLPNVLQLLALGGKTGCLAVERKPVHGAIYFEGGTVVWAEIVSAGDRLGDHLVRSGKITRDQLRHAIQELTHNASLTLAEVLVSSEILARGELDRFVQHQVEEAIHLMCSWPDGQFTFTANLRPPRHAVPVALQAMSLLIETMRRADEWLVIQQAIPSFDGTYRRASLRPGAANPQLTLDQHRILPLLDGTRDVNGVIELSGLSAYEVAKALLELIIAGAVQLQERRASAKHFSDVELHAYAYKQGDFTDPERRKDAARHIADCQMCGSRLREFHLRRTQGTGQTPATAAPAPPAPAPAAPAASAPQPPRPQAPTPKPPADGRRTTDFVWLMSPEEADKVRRTHRTNTSAPAPPATRPPAAASAPPPPGSVAPDATVPSATPAPPTPAPKPGMQTAARLIAVPPPRPAPSAAEVSEPSQPAPPTPEPPLAEARPKWRIPAIAAAGIVVVAGGYLAARALSARGARPVETAAASVPAPASAAPAAASPVVAPADSAAPPRDSARTTRAESSVTRPRADTVRHAAPAQPPHDTPVTRTPPPSNAPAAAAVTASSAAPERPAPAPTPAVAVEPAGPDGELASGGWRVIERAEAASALGGRIGMIPGLRLESIASSEARGRTRVRVAQIARTGQRIVLIETATGDAPSGAARATAVSVMPPEGSGESIGSASLGNLQITARSALPPEALTPLLARLALAR